MPPTQPAARGSDRGIRQLSPLGNIYAGSFLLLIAVGFPVSLAASSYFGHDWLGSLAFRANDGWCSVGHESVGVHCFGDFALFMNRGSIAEIDTVYTPLVRYGFGFLNWIQLFVPYQIVMFAFLSVLAACALAPAVWASRRMGYLNRVVVLASAGFLTLPFIALMDRGNVLALAPPLLLSFALAIERRPNVAVWMVVALVQLRPQFLALAVIFMVLRRWRQASWSIFLSLFVLVLSFSPFTLLGSSPSTEFQQWVERIAGFVSRHSLADDYPTNISLARSLFVLSKPLGISEEQAGTLALGICLLLLIGVLLVGNRRPLIWSITTVFTVVAVGPEISFMYYAVLWLPLLAVFIEGTYTQNGILRSATTLPLSPWSVLVTVGLLLVMVPVPIPVFGLATGPEAYGSAGVLMSNGAPPLGAVALVLASGIGLFRGVHVSFALSRKRWKGYAA